MARIVMQCLEKSPDQRPQRAGEIVRALRGTPAGGVAATRGTGPMSAIPAWVPWVVAFVATGVAVFFAVHR